MLKMTPRKPVNLRWLCLLLLFTSDALGCGEGFFGSRCQFKCHCRDGCDQTGACVGDSPCVNGWFGPRCQYFDLAVPGKVFWVGEKFGTITELTDGNDSTCLRDPQKGNYEIKILWKKEYQITWIRLNGIMDWQNLTLLFETTSFKLEACTNQRITTVSATTVDVHCDLRKDVVTAIMAWNTNYTLCSVHISGGRNVAIKERATQSTNYDNVYTADKAVDGITRTKLWEDSCSHTATHDERPYWDLHFRRPVSVYWLQIHNRGDCCLDRLKGFIVEMFNTSFEYRYHDNSPGAHGVYYVHTLLQGTSRIRIRATNMQNLFLTLCEVEVYGDYICPNGSYGLDCEQRCNCAMKGEQCYVETGDCASGCAPGYYGERCSKDCPNGRWGVDCAKVCNVRCVNGLCSRTTGFCDNGCVKGYQPPSCDNVCTTGYHGDNCQKRCPIGCDSRGCDLNSGICHNCTPGYLGGLCNQVCPFGHHGNNCSQTCPAGCLDGGCDHVRGQCHTCVTGYQGATCYQVCYDGYYGNNCSQLCSVGCMREECDHVTGRCFRCVPGYQGDTCDTECDYGQWGENCSNSCNVLCLYRSCDHVTGQCLKGCEPGYQEPNCTEACTFGSHGNNCSQTCPIGCSQRGCDHVTWRCYGCIHGYQDPSCDRECDLGQWGPGCSQSCSRLCLNGSCDHVTGQCDKGCVAEYLPPNCTEECGHGQWGVNCSNPCHTLCFNGSCDHVTGQCDIVCEPGDQSNNCKQVKNPTSKFFKSRSSVATLGISVASITIAIVLAAIVVCMYRRKRKLLTGLRCPEILSIGDGANVSDQMMTNDSKGLMD